MTVKEYCTERGKLGLGNIRHPVYVTSKRSKVYGQKMRSWYFSMWNEERVEVLPEGAWMNWRWMSINSVSFFPTPKRNKL